MVAKVTGIYIYTINKATLDAAEALVRENYRESPPSEYADGHLTCAEALKRCGYIGTHGVVVLRKRLGATTRCEVLKDLIEAQYPEVLFDEAPEPEIQPGSPMSQLGDVTESESLGEPDAEIASEAAADVSMAERSVSDILVVSI